MISYNDFTEAEKRVIWQALSHSQEWIHTREELDAQDSRDLKTIERIRKKIRGSK